MWGGGGNFGALGGLWGDSWRLLGARGDPIGDFIVFIVWLLGGSWGHLAASWGRLEPS